MRDPHEVLELRPGATPEEVRAAYRRLVQKHHPDHNAGSRESALRFEEVQEAYAALRDGAPAPPPKARPPADSGVDARMVEMERELREAGAARAKAERALRDAAREAVAAARPDRASDEDLGYVTTDDSFSKILSDARREFEERPLARRVSDLAGDFERLVAKLTGEDKRE
ncbi:MAG TPA: J domain-containing protein [Solirubrobacteraceae bacterium]|jgi:curved DNA-binding protein CbpA|nr:J domain-containing protein [Solirubrobacteraceae bacterium]